MKIICKYVISDGNTYLPKGAEILHIGVQNDQLCIWALVDENERSKVLRVKTYSTGEDCGADINDYYGTFLLYGGRAVMHIFLPKS